MSTINHYQCPNCDASLQFDPKTQKLHCSSCDGNFELDTFLNDKDFDIPNQTYQENDLDVYVCESCGGQLVTDKQTVATQCPYCNSPMILKGNVSGDYRPSKVIPFQYDKNQAIENLKKHLMHKVLLPSDFKSQAILNEIKGLYVPFWTFDGKANARMWFNATKVRRWSDHDFDYTETSYFKLFRAGNVSFADVPVDASSKVEDDLSQSIEPFDTSGYQEFNENYLVGFYGDKYDVSPEVARETANARISNSAQSLVSSTTIGYDTVVPIDSHVSIQEGKQEYVMMPMWLLNVNYHNEHYQFAMNGQTGKFVGNLPMDKTKLFFLLLASFSITTILVTMLLYFIY